ncbi:hypothetical protein ACGFNU_10225 [Spirillospora sp. NPDC048911]|uniref:hypothetical protein n=1 Tax=Spirillospora sp. NPDC048911 TaxID=3364527 RepID=UPI0037149E4D
MTDYLPERDPEDNIDDMGDDEQADDVALAEEYVESPPPTIADDGNEGSIGITEYEREVSPRGSGPFPPPVEPAEEAALHEEDDRTT